MVRVPAKVNLHLSVGDRRPDGYHDLTTVFQAVSLYDEVTVEPARRLTVDVRGEGARVVPRGDDNLAVQAVRAVAALTGRAPTVRITIRKAIPVSAGMAGGSADAAATLLACDQLWGAGLGKAELARLAAGLGSDVPFVLHGGTALATGRGEQLTPVLGRGSYHWVFAIADGGLETAEVYREFDRLRTSGVAAAAGSPDGVLAALRAGDAVALGRVLSNDLQPAAMTLRPSLRRVIDAGRELGAVGAIVCGSGPTVALLTRTSNHGINVAAALAGMDVCRAVRRASGPVAGARLQSGGAS
jgi:4-diphosphocytidyl-2-C-methyl-D-erythritol kinase